MQGTVYSTLQCLHGKRCEAQSTERAEVMAEVQSRVYSVAAGAAARR